MNTPASLSPICQQLEDYLFGLLTAEQSMSFEQHCDLCGNCRAAVLAEQNMKSAVRTAVTNESLAVAVSPARLTGRPDIADASGTSDGVSGRSAAVTMALLTLAALLLMAFVTRQVESPEPRSVAEARLASDANVEVTRRSPIIQLGDDAMGVTLESGDPNVVVMLLFDRRPRGTPDTESISPESPGGSPLVREFN